MAERDSNLFDEEDRLTRVARQLESDRQELTALREYFALHEKALAYMRGDSDSFPDKDLASYTRRICVVRDRIVSLQKSNLAPQPSDFPDTSL